MQLYTVHKCCAKPQTVQNVRPKRQALRINNDYHITFVYVDKLSRKRKWLTRFYQNSEAYHERAILSHSKNHQEDLRHIHKCWGSEIPEQFMIPVKSPQTYPDDLGFEHDFEVLDYLGVTDYTEYTDIDPRNRNGLDNEE